MSDRVAQNTDAAANDAAAVKAALERLIARQGHAASVARLTRLTGGASQAMWSFDLVCDSGVQPLILRLAGAMRSADDDAHLSLPDEARLLDLVRTYDVPVPAVWHVLGADDALGEGYIMQRLEGETLPPRILRDDAYAGARELLARQCGQVLAGIHQVPVRHAPFLRRATAAEALAQQYREYSGHAEPRPVFELAFRWLRTHLPAQTQPPALVHGDFRNGNLMIGPEGLRAVLDWELAGIGDPMADLGWLCVDSWRFGQIDQPVGGFGNRDQLFAGYEDASGQRVCRERVTFWEIFGCLKWGIICQKMAYSFVSGADRTVERGAIGRRASEAEIDLLQRLAPLA